MNLPSLSSKCAQAFHWRKASRGSIQPTSSLVSAEREPIPSPDSRILFLPANSLRRLGCLLRSLLLGESYWWSPRAGERSLFCTLWAQVVLVGRPWRKGPRSWVKYKPPRGEPSEKTRTQTNANKRKAPPGNRGRFCIARGIAAAFLRDLLVAPAVPRLVPCAQWEIYRWSLRASSPRLTGYD